MPTTIFTSFNENYAKMGASLIASLWNNEPGDFQLVVLDTGIRKITREQLIQWAKKEKRVLDFIEVEPQLYTSLLSNNINIPSDYPYYARLLCPYLAKRNENILYLDADIICLSSFLHLMQIELENHIVAALEDARYKQFDQPYFPPHSTSIIPNYAELGCTGKEPYFNSGVLLINVEKWKQQGISQKVLELTQQYPDHAILWDQYGLNIALKDQWKNLDPQWNQTIDATIPGTIFRHFADVKPIDYGCTHPDAALFFHYLNQSPFKGWRPTRINQFLKEWKSFRNSWRIRFKKLKKILAIPS